MKQNDELANTGGEHGGFGAEIEDPMLRGAVRNFSSSVHAWSEAAHSQARPASAPVTGPLAWRRIVAAALGLVITAGLAGSGVFELRHRQAQEQRAHEQAVERQKDLAVKRSEEEVQKVEDAQNVEDLLAKVDSDVSREVPAAMDPLAQLMGDDDTQ